MDADISGRSAGQPLEMSDCEEETDDDEEEEAECDDGAVDKCAGLHVGMQLGAGSVLEIFPRFDKFTVAFRTAAGGTEIRHHTISKDAGRLISKQAARDAKSASVDVNAMD